MTTPSAQTRGRSRQGAWLAALIVVLGGVVWYQFFRTTGAPATASNPAGAIDRSSGNGPMPSPQVVRLAALDAVPEAGESTRNPFAFAPRPTPPPQGPMAPRSMPAGPAGAGPAMTFEPQGPPPIAVKLVGITVIPETGRTMVTLKDPVSNAVFQGFEGEIVDGRYRVVKIGAQSVVLSYVDGTGLRTVPLGG